MFNKLLFIFSAVMLPIKIISAQSLPPINLQYASVIVNENGTLFGYIGEKNRVEVKSTGNVSKYVIRCLIATEDRDFYNHDGVSYEALGRAVLKTLTGSKQGGSTLTMQLARNLFLSHEQTLSRKLSEINLARALEEKYSKDEILLMYLNTVYFGKGAYGIWAAAEEYFSKTPDQLSISESALLVGLLKSPAGYDPVKDPSKALERRNEVLYNLVEVGKLSKKEFQKLKREPVKLKLRQRIAQSFSESIRREAEKIVSIKGLSLYRDKLKITATLDVELQKAAESAVAEQWNQFSGTTQNAQIGLVTIETTTGKIKALVGGDPKSDPGGLNHALQIKRQPGSAFKPFLYGSLLEKGFTLATPLLDAPIIVDSGSAYEWKPMNDDDSFSGQNVTMKYAIQKSLNLAAAHAIAELSNPDTVAAFAKRVGIESPLHPYPSIVLGTSEVSPVEMAAAFSVFANGGYYSKPYSIITIEDENSRIIYSNETDERVSVLDSATAYLITDALKAVVDSGTASVVRNFYKYPAAGKTGTTQNSTDAWFIGYTTHFSTAIWIGFDDARVKLKDVYRYGGTACAPIWGRMMAAYVKSNRGSAGEDFKQPDSVEQMELCPDSGLLATGLCPNRSLFFVDKNKLPPICFLHNPD